MARTRDKDGKILDRGLGRGAPSTLAGEEEHIGASVSQAIAFPGGTYDTSLLVKYEQHIARHLWFSEVSKRPIFDIE